MFSTIWNISRHLIVDHFQRSNPAEWSRPGCLQVPRRACEGNPVLIPRSSRWRKLAALFVGGGKFAGLRNRHYWSVLMLRRELQHQYRRADGRYVRDGIRRGIERIALSIKQPNARRHRISFILARNSWDTMLASMLSLMTRGVMNTTSSLRFPTLLVSPMSSPITGILLMMGTVSRA
jgi:hypothetical protein